LRWDDGEATEFDRLEMPKLHLGADGCPEILFLSAKPKGADDAFGLVIRLRP
jgi:hypothetical protein